MQESSTSKTTFIYGLCDPRTGVLRYVGKSDKPDFRLYIHIWDAKKRPTNRVHFWIRSLLREGLEPEQFIIEECADEDWIEAETFWIGYCRFLGCDLVNHTSGGEGLWNPSPEVRAKMSAKQKGRKISDEERARRSIRFRGDANPFYGRHHSEESKDKQRAVKTGKPSLKKGKPAPEGAIYYRTTYIVTYPPAKAGGFWSPPCGRICQSNCVGVDGRVTRVVGPSDWLPSYPSRLVRP